MVQPHYIQLHKIGKYPLEKFNYTCEGGSDPQTYPLQLFFAGSSQWCRGIECERSNSPYTSIEFVREGVFRLEEEGRTVEAHAGELLFLHPDVHTRLSCVSETGSKYVFALTGSLLPEILDNIGFRELLHAVPTQRELWENFADEIEALFQQAQAEPVNCALFAYRLLLEVRLINQLHRYPPVLQNLLRYIRIHIAEAPQLAVLTRESGISQAGIYRLFQRHMHTSPVDYIRDLRIRRAAELLRISEYSVKEIADHLHYSSSQYFAGEFRKKYRLSPRDYRINFRDQANTPHPREISKKDARGTHGEIDPSRL